jgi:hypothetical protein
MENWDCRDAMMINWDWEEFIPYLCPGHRSLGIL